MYRHTCLKCGNTWTLPEKNLKCDQCGAEGKVFIGYAWEEVPVKEVPIKEEVVKDNIGFSADIQVKEKKNETEDSD